MISIIAILSLFIGLMAADRMGLRPGRFDAMVLLGLLLICAFADMLTTYHAKAQVQKKNRELKSREDHPSS